jgi:4-hydroxy-tetrahydrodipicolinate synthase
MKAAKGKLVQKMFSGSYAVTVTPFTEDGSGIDVPALKRFLDWQLEVGVPGIILLGTIGEFMTVTDEERSLYVETTIKHINGRIPVLVGTMNLHTPTAVRYSKEAEQMGADGLMILPPYYFTPTDEEVFDYYRTICEAVSLPIMLYNNPFTTHVDLSAQMVGRLARAFENIRYIKEASKAYGRIYDILEETQGLVKVFAGDRVILAFMQGAVGYVNPFGSYMPLATTRIWNYLAAGRMDDARKIERDLTRIYKMVAEGHPRNGYLCYQKGLAAAAGYPMGDTRPPLMSMRGLGEQGRLRCERIAAVIREMDAMVGELDRLPAAAE